MHCQSVYLRARTHKCTHVRWIIFQTYTDDASTNQLNDISE